MTASDVSSSDFFRRFLRLAIVNIFSNLLVPIAGFLDIAFLGHLTEIRHLAGVALTTVIFNYLYWTFGFLRMGTTGMTAQAVGRNDPEAIRLIALRNGTIAIAIGLCIVIFQAPIQTIGFALLSATSEVKASGQAFYTAMIWGAPATLLNFVLIGYCLGRSQSDKVLLLSAVNNLVNVSLDYLFVVKWGWASTGAGASTAIAQYFMLFIGLFFVRDIFKPIPWQQFCDRTELKAIFTLNRDLMIRTLTLISTFAVFTNLSSAFSTTTLTVNTLLLQVVTFSAYFIDGFAFATETLAGTYYTSRSHLIRLLKIAGLHCITVGLIFAIGFITFPTALFQVLTNHQTILMEIQPFVGWLLPVLGFGAIAYLLDGYFLGLTAGRILRISSLWATVLGFFPIAILAWKVRSAHLLWLALATFMLTRAMTLALQVPSTLSSKSDKN